MPTDSLRDAAFCDVLNRELVCALGCTEPIAVAYAAALASQTLGCEPDHMDVACSGNIIKNVKSVTVPNSGGMHGIEAAAVLGARADDVACRARARAAAGSDARMNGCALPVAIVCGSGNQGITCALPVMEYAEYLRCDHERLVRAVMLSDLIAVHIKSYIGALSAFCGAICAACGAGAAITWLCGGTREQIGATVSNTLGNVGGIVCDGAKASCAAKISAAVDAAILGHDMAMQGRGFRAGEGLIQDTVEQTIASMGYVGRVGMKDTDVEILNIMIGKTQVC